MQPSLQTPRAALLGLGAALLLILSACTDHPGEAAAEAALAAGGAQDVEIDEDGERISYRTEEGEVTITGGEAASLPDDFPEDVYLPGDYVVESTLAMNADLFIGLAVDDDVPALYASARESMAGHGWTETMAALENNENGLLTFEKDDRSAVVSLSRGDDGTTMGLQLTRAAQ